MLIIIPLPIQARVEDFGVNCTRLCFFGLFNTIVIKRRPYMKSLTLEQDSLSYFNNSRLVSPLFALTLGL